MVLASQEPEIQVGTPEVEVQVITVDDFEYLVPIDQVRIARVIPNLG